MKAQPRNPQLQLLKRPSLAYGGQLLNTRKGRAGGRPLSTKDSMHLVLRSSKAVGAWSFRNPKNKKSILHIIEKFAQKYAVKIQSMANVGNHLHLHIQLVRRDSYRPFIRAVTGAIAIAVTGASRWQSGHREGAAVNSESEHSTSGSRHLAGRTKQRNTKLKFWDYRPFTRVVRGFRAVINLKNYIQINFWESQGLQRAEARARLSWRVASG